MNAVGRWVIGAMFVATLALTVRIGLSAQGVGDVKLNCQNAPCDSVARGRAAFNDRNLRELGGNGRACADCHVPSEHFQLSPAVALSETRVDGRLSRRAVCSSELSGRRFQQHVGNTPEARRGRVAPTSMAVPSRRCKGAPTGPATHRN